MRENENDLIREGFDPLAVSIEQAAKLSASSRSEIYEALARRQLAAKKLGRRTLILKHDLREFLRSLPSYHPREPE